MGLLWLKSVAQVCSCEITVFFIKVEALYEWEKSMISDGLTPEPGVSGHVC